MNKYKIIRIGIQFLSVSLVMILLYTLLIKLNVITLTSSDLPLAIVLSNNELGLKVGDSYQLESTIYPYSVDNSSIIWSSSDDSIVSVDKQSGYIKAHKSGVAIIKSILPINNLENECIVYVNDKDILSNNISFINDKIFLSQGDSYKLNYKLTPSNSNNHDFIFLSSDNSIAIVNENGVIKAIDSGKVMITIKSKINNISDNILINVDDNINNNNSEKLELSEYYIEMGIGYKTKINTNITNNVNWISSNNNVATVDSNGIVNAINEGIVYIIATTSNGKSGLCEINISKNFKDESTIKFEEEKLELKIGEIKNIKYSFLKPSIYFADIMWKSSNNNIALVENGIIKAINKGECVITISSSSGNYQTSINVNVKENDEFIKIEELLFLNKEYDVNIGDTIDLKPIIEPSNATNHFVSWSSSNNSVASVSDGLVKCIKEGKAIITAKVGDKTSTIKVNVNSVLPSLISIENGFEINLSVGDSRYLIKKIVPLNATKQNVKWYSNDTSIVEVLEDGLIKAKKVGSSVISVETVNGKRASIKVNVQ